MPFLPPIKPDSLEPLRYRTNENEPVLVPHCFPRDIATIPRALRFVFKGKHRKAAVIHDWLYYKHGHTMGMQFTRQRCDEIFLEAMKASGVGYLTRMAMYYAVRIGGWYPWYSTSLE